MSIVHQFDYFKPASIAETVDFLSKNKNAAILAGGTDLVNNIREEIDSPDIVIDIKGLDELKKITFTDNKLSIGALVSFTDLIESEIIKKHFPLITEISKTVGTFGVRNRATLVGNICSSVPCMDSGPLLRIYNGEITTIGQSGERKISAEDWFVGPKESAIKPGELVTEVSIPFPAEKHAGCFVKLRRSSGEDIAQVSVAILALINNSYRISFGAVAPVPVRAKKIEKVMNGNQLNDSLIEKAKALIHEEITPITDIRASKEYRMHMAKVMFERCVKAAVQRLNGNGPLYGTSLI